jgi:uncharacterized protein (DUF1800 family)
MDAALRALNRFGLGARPGERQRVRDPKLWLRQQLEGGPPPLASAPIPPTPSEIGDAVRRLRDRRDDPEQRRDARRRLVQIGVIEARAALTTRVTSARPFVERLVAFWANHLCVSAGAKALVAPLAGSYEREAIRPHVLGRFEDMVLASAKHPAMLVYLDNFQSIGPSSAGARSSAGRGGTRGRGLNENYARELLELHTLGVNGGYTQQDVQSLARILTGWTIDGIAAAGMARTPRAARRGDASQGDGPVRFAFRPRLHEPGEKDLLGTRYTENGLDEGERAIRALCRHPATAQFVARKLVTHFVSDEPPAAAIARVAGVFSSTDGDLKAVAAAMVDLPEAWRDDTRKFRTPQDWVVAMLRGLDARAVGERLPATLRQLRQPLWAPQAPKGYGDTMLEWADPDALLNRGELARSVPRLVDTAHIDPRTLLELTEVPAGDPLAGLLSDTSIPVHDRLALGLASPPFQWR